MIVKIYSNKNFKLKKRKKKKKNLLESIEKKINKLYDKMAKL